MPVGVVALAQTADGFLWIGTEFGLLRFDGVRFQPWAPPRGQNLPNSYITALMAARDGSLWIGTRGGLSHWNGGAIDSYQTSKGETGPVIATILEDDAGQVWAGTVGVESGGLCRLTGKVLDCDLAKQQARGVLSLMEDRGHNLWFGGPAGLCRWKPGPAAVYRLRERRGLISSIAEDRDGVVWGSTNGLDGLVRVSGSKLISYRAPGASPGMRPDALLTDREGNLWIGTFGQGIGHLIQGQMDQFTRADGLSSDVVHCLFEDREGNIWAGTENGLDRFRKFPVTVITKREGLAGQGVTSVVASKSGGVWVGGISGLDRIEPSGMISHVEIATVPRSITGMFEDADGRLLLSSDRGLAYLDHGRIRDIRQAGTGTIGAIAAATEARDGTVWLSDPRRGLARLRDGEIQEIVPWSKFDNKQALALGADPNGNGIWLGFSQGGIAHWQQGRPIRWYSSVDGLGSGAVMALHFSDGALWVATQSGLSRLWQDRIINLGTKNGLPCEQIHDIVEDNDRTFWLNTACGLMRIRAADLDSWSAISQSTVPLTLYDSSDGMRSYPTPKGYNSRATKSTDGCLWFNVLDGVAEIDPAHILFNSLPPPLQIERIRADGKGYPLQSSIRLAALTKDLEIEYTALSLVDAEKVHFRYRLDGADTEWHDAGDRREATYANLSPRHYRFRVIASNNDGVWNKQGAGFDLIVPPAFYQTRWFVLLCVAAAGGFLWGVYRLRVRQIAAKLHLRFRERLAERMRIARELHDNVLQNISGMALQLDGLSKIVNTPAAKERLRDLREQSEQWLHDAREAVWDLRSAPLEGRDFVTALRETGEQITGGTTSFHLSVAGRTRPIGEQIEVQLVRIVREAIRNSVSHSEARHIVVNVSYMRKDKVEIEIQDDGSGFILEEGSQKMGHWGLAGMQERAQQIGAEFRIATSPGHGTRIMVAATYVPGNAKN